MVVVGAIGVLNLVLTLGVIRRLRARHDPPPNPPTQPSRLSPVRATGAPVGAFTTWTSQGEPVSTRFFADGITLVGAFTEGCPACQEQLPAFLELARSFSGGRQRALVLLVGDPEALADKHRLLAPIATVVHEPEHAGRLGTALGIRAYPAFAIIDGDGVVRASGAEIEELLLALVEV
ncbi:redoxin family protein [Thermopolyspora sp. NPDC052614]|uniref:TlpA family protein disulfide reductase n=1 Tax=Thermopolyspora sp. NPDC052614 TaxID=3155682 RepID=UPI0034217188